MPIAQGCDLLSDIELLCSEKLMKKTYLDGSVEEEDVSCLVSAAQSSEFGAWYSISRDRISAWNGTTPRDWNGGAPDTTWDSASDDTGGDAANRELALCVAASDLIDFLCDWELSNRTSTAASISIAISALAGIGGAAFGPIAAVAGALLAGLVDLSFVAFKELSAAVLEDADAREKVACCAYNSLSGAAISQATLASSLSSCSFTAGSNAEQIAGAIAGILNSKEAFAAMIDFVSIDFLLADADELGNCPCECPALRFLQSGGSDVGYGDLTIDGTIRTLTATNYSGGSYGIWIANDPAMCPDCEKISIEILSITTNGNDWIGGEPRDCDYQPLPDAPNYLDDPPSALIGVWEATAFNLSFDGPFSLYVKFSEL